MTVLLIVLVAVSAWNAVETRRLRLSLLSPNEPPMEVEPLCLHPSEYRLDISTSGTWRWRCDRQKGGCGYEHAVPMPRVQLATSR